MAGGDGLRLRPLTCDRPKPLVPVCNRPVITYTLDLLADHGVREVFLTLGYMPGPIPRQLGDEYRGMRLHYRVEEEPLGTAGSVAALREHLDETFLVLSGDTLTDVDLSALVAFHRRSGALATLGLTRVENPLAYGLVLTDNRGRIRRFLEKPGWGEIFSDTANTGIYVLEPAALVGVPPRRPYDFSRQLFPSLLQMEAPLYGLVLDGYWCDIGDPAAYLQANLDLLAGRLRFSPPGREVAPGVWGSRAPEPGVTVEGPALIGEGCRLLPGACLRGGVVLGPGTVVGPGASLTRSVAWSGVHLEEGVTVTGAVIGQGVSLGARAAVCEGAVVGSNCGIGAGASVAPGVRLWPGSQVEDGAVAECSLRSPVRWRVRPLQRGSLTGTPGEDLFPDRVLRVGTVFAGVLGAGGPVVVGSDPGSRPDLVRQALICGVLAAGRDVVDAGTTAAPVTAFVAGREGAAGALHVLSDGREVRVRFLGPGGRPAGRELQRRLEQACQRQEMPWGVRGEAGTVRRATDMEELYLEVLARQVAVEAVREAGFAVRVLGGGGPLLSRWLRRLGCQVDGDRADLTVVVAPLEGGWRLDGTDPVWMLVLDLYLQARGRPRGTEVAVPPTAPSAATAFLREHGWRPVTVPLTAWHPTDPFLGVSLLLDWLAQERLTVRDAMASLPRAYMAEGRVPCPWKARGRVMRRLLEMYPEGPAPLPEGIRVAGGDGSVLVMPDPDEPSCRIMAEADSPAAAQALLERFMRQVSALVREETG